MKLNLQRSDLLRAAEACAAIADKKSTMPILANLKLDADAGTLSATDLYLQTTQTIDATDSGSVCVPARDFADRVRNMPDGELTVSTNKALAVTIKSGKRRYTMMGISGDDFPELQQFAGEWQEVERLPLLDAIEATLYAISTDETRLHLNSLFMTSEEGKLVCVATDGHRLALDRQPIAWECGPKANILVPRNGALILRKLLSDAKSSKSVLVGVTESRLHVSNGNDKFAVKLVDAEFPPYQQVIPERSTAEIRIDRLALLNAARAVSVAASERTGGIKLSFKDGECIIESISPEGGEGYDSIPIETEHDGELFFGCSGKYLAEALSSFVGDTVTLGVSGELDPVTIGDGGQRLNVTMPMRV